PRTARSPSFRCIEPGSLPRDGSFGWSTSTAAIAMTQKYILLTKLNEKISLIFRVILRLTDHIGAAGAVRPILPGAPRLRRIRLITGGACGDLALRQRLRLAAHLATNAQRIHLHPRIARQINRKPHHFDDRARGRGKAMAAHQRDVAGAEAFGEIAALRHVRDEQIGVAELGADVPYRHLAADETAGMDHRL